MTSWPVSIATRSSSQGLQAGARVAGFPGLVEDVAELAALGLVHRQVCVLQQHGRALAVRREHGDTDGWNYPDRALLHPDAFLPLAEQAGSMCLFTLHVLERSLFAVRAWRAAGDQQCTSR